MRRSGLTSTPALAALFVPLWSTGFITARLVAGHVEPLTFLTWRFVAAGLVLAGLAGVLKQRWPRSPAVILQALVAGFLIHGVYLGCVFWSVSAGLPAGIAALVAGLQPLFTGVLAGPLLQETVTRRRWVGIGLGAAGALLTLVPKLGVAGAGGVPAGPLAVCGAGVLAITLGTLWQKRRGAGGDLIPLTALQYVGALGPAALGMGLLESGQFDWGSVAAVSGFVWSIFGLSIGAILLLMVLIGRGAVAQVAALLYLVPGVSALMAFALFGETLTLVQVSGLALAAAGVAIASRG